MVAGVGPGKAGQEFEEFRFTTLYLTPRRPGANVSVIYVPPPIAADAIMEAVDTELIC
jgi:succinyl-CoA synthetase alpha subunit